MDLHSLTKAELGAINHSPAARGLLAFCRDVVQFRTDNPNEDAIGEAALRDAQRCWASLVLYLDGFRQGAQAGRDAERRDSGLGEID